MMQIKIEINGVLIHFVNVVNTGQKFINGGAGDTLLCSIMDWDGTTYNVALNGVEPVQVGHDPDDGALRLAEIALGKLT